MLIRRGTFRVSNRSDVCIYISFIYNYLYIYQWIVFLQAVICFFLNIMIQYFVIRNFRGTCSYVEMLKVYMLIFRNAGGVHAHLSQCWRGRWSKKGRETLQWSLQPRHHEIFLYMHQLLHYWCPLRLNCCSPGVNRQTTGTTTSSPDSCFCSFSYDMSSSIHQSRATSAIS